MEDGGREDTGRGLARKPTNTQGQGPPIDQSL